MNFWFKRKKIILDCFTADAFSYEYCKIERAVKHYPDWWLDLPSENKNVNMKSCRGFTNMYTNSYIIPFWTTVSIDVDSIAEKKFQWKASGLYSEIIQSSTRKIIVSHHRDQTGNFLKSGNYQHIKLLSSWSIRSKSDTKFFYSDPMWHKDDLNIFTVLPGIVEYKYNQSTEFNIMFEYKPMPYTIEFTPGMPLAMLTPLTEDEIEFRHHLVTPNEMIYEFERFGFNKDANRFNLRKKFMDKAHNNTQTCPFKK